MEGGGGMNLGCKQIRQFLQNPAEYFQAQEVGAPAYCILCNTRQVSEYLLATITKMIPLL